MKLAYSLKQKKIIVTLMIKNFFALVVNYFGIKGNFNDQNSHDGVYFNLFTNSAGFSSSNLWIQYENEYHDNGEQFWPLVKFTDNDNFLGNRFYGIFAYYDLSEFIFYSILIFGIPLGYNFFRNNK